MVTKVIDGMVDKVGGLVSHLNLVLILLICVDVALRYLFSVTKVWVLDLEWHLFAVIFLIGASYTLQADKHVRVDVFFERFSPKTKAWIDIVGTILFLIPWCIIAVITSYKYALNSWYIREGAADPGGMPMRYIIKAVIVLGFVLLLLQGISLIIAKLRMVIKG